MKPHEAAIIFAYKQGYRTAEQIAKLYNYKTKRPVEKVLAKYRNQILPMSRKTLFVGNNTIYSP